MNNRRENQIRAWLLVLGILFILGMMATLIILAVQQSMRQVRQAVQPVNDMTSNLGTQVSQRLNPTPTILADPVTVIYQVRSLARLETIQYSVEKVITAETGQGVFAPLFGDRILFVAHGIVIAGVDLSKMGPKDMWTQDNVLYVRLPEAEVFISTLDNEKSYVYNRDTGLLTHGDINLESDARRVAEDEIEKAALEDGILTQANQNAENYMYRLLRDLGFPEVIFSNENGITPTP
jgi:hypothetical protein